MTAQEQMNQALLDLAERGQCTPCQGRRRDRWTSDDHVERAWAAAVCLGLDCQVLTECKAVATETRPSFGVWAGVDRTPSSGKRATDSRFLGAPSPDDSLASRPYLPSRFHP